MYRDSLNLPRTEFPMRARLPQREPELLQRWRELDLYGRIRAERRGGERFILHDGPPYANGSIHMGHVLNKLLKDMVVRSRTMMGMDAPYVPGWDCHGLPIEHQVDLELGEAKRDMTTAEVRRACREYAERFVAVQREEFERLGVLGTWSDPYLTMDHAYEAEIASALHGFLLAGYVTRGFKPVHWSWGARTALAEAEVEYHSYDAPSIYVRFPFLEPAAWLAEAAGGRAVDVVIWTTTPWTVPANLAIALHPAYEYQLLALDDAHALLIAAELVGATRKACRLGELPVLHTFRGRELVGDLDEPVSPRPAARHPLIDRPSVLLPAEYVTLEQGTGCVHTAPGHGQEDFELGRRHGLEPYAPVDDDGRFTSDVPEHAGEHVFDANPRIVQELADAGRLLNRPGDVYRVERYPYCWRTKTPLIFRATPQWFIRMDCNDLRARALEAVGTAAWIPAWGQPRIEGMIDNRPDWCISRQRSWGVPIAVLTCAGCGEVAVDEVLFDHIRELFLAEGADAWFEHPVSDLAPAGYSCRACGSTDLKRETDILDVWFDSGVSHLAVCDTDRYGLDWPADLYLEGQDQYRGWFQSSLMVAVGLKGAAPYRGVLTHGFIVDAEGHKMSKSLGNVIRPSDLLTSYGADILRLWTAMIDFREDMRISDEIMSRTAEAYRKVRNTLRFLLGNLADFDPERDAVPLDRIGGVDAYLLRRGRRLAREVIDAYRAFDLSTVAHRVVSFCTVEMSSLYLDVLKDRLYCDHPDDPARRASQTVLFTLAETLATLIAPVLCFTAEEVWSALPGARSESVHLGLFRDLDAVPENREDDDRFRRLLSLRDLVLGQLEGQRQAGALGKSEQARVDLTGDAVQLNEDLDATGSDLETLCIVSSVELTGDEPQGDALASYPGLGVSTSAWDRPTCSRCWRRFESLVDDPALPDLCPRCHRVVSRLVEEGRFQAST